MVASSSRKDGLEPQYPESTYSGALNGATTIVSMDDTKKNGVNGHFYDGKIEQEEVGSLQNGSIEEHEAGSSTLGVNEGGNAFMRFLRTFKMAKPGEVELVNEENAMKQRHLIMVAVGGNVGTGLFVATGKSLKNAGPASLLIAYIIMGSVAIGVVVALAEMCCMFPKQSSIVRYTSRFVNRNIAFAESWLYYFIWMAVLPSEVSAGAMIVNFWNQNVPVAVWITIFLLFILVIQGFGARGYGEAEFISAFLKVLIMLIFFVVAIVIDCGGAPNSTGYLGAHYWHDPGAFRNGFKGFCSVFVACAYSLSGTENVGTAAGNTANPQKAIPKAVTQVFLRTLFFYVIIIFLLTLVVPYNAPNLGDYGTGHSSASPFILAIKLAGIRGLPHIFNAITLVAVLSVGNMSVFAASRSMIALTEEGWAPKCLARLDQKGRPLFCFALSFAFSAVAYVNVSERASKCLTGFHIRMRWAMRTQGYGDSILPYQFPGSIYLSIWAMIINFLASAAVIYVGLFPVTHAKPSAKNFFLETLGLVVFSAFLLLSFCLMRPKISPLNEIDLVTERYDQGENCGSC
ncbi:APC amino acid transporter [Schizosaccharomyces japonicus yFS275]|uniref:APC amino acid transporter n=1 Tax=Schizosaccharomyces japonicus (strain yFS275 / FY16936) TaxID=402676 RepID=B6K7S8_SCHJY|nr:APC amino acid transporter [Schizosaccharomyces japonicus yFS275]EEB09582.2 APC amino acid transporter [Schizosaccharomyces japonicus yFS275]